MITDEEMLKRIELVCETYSGQGDKLAEVIGLIVMGRFYGWRVVRLASPSRSWPLAVRLFGDLTSGDLMPERGRFAHRSFGLKIVDGMKDYWEVVRRHVSVPASELRMISD